MSYALDPERNNQMWKISIFTCLLLLGQGAYASTIVSCGENAGHAFYYPGLMIPQKDAGWHEDGTSGGKFALTLSDEKLDILFYDATSVLQSARDTGGTVTLLGAEGAWITVLVNYPKQTAELYTFNIDTKRYAMSSHKYGAAPIQKAATVVGKCN